MAKPSATARAATPPKAADSPKAAASAKAAASRPTTDDSTTRLPKTSGKRNDDQIDKERRDKDRRKDDRLEDDRRKDDFLEDERIDIDELSYDEIRPSRARYIPALIVGGLLLVVIVATSVGLAMFLHRDNDKTMEDSSSDYVLQGSIGAGAPASSNKTGKDDAAIPSDADKATPVTPPVTPAPDANAGTKPPVGTDPTDPTSTDPTNTAPKATPATPDATEEDVDMVADGAIPLTGKVKIAKDGSFFLDWGTTQSILLKQPDGTSVILDKVSSAYLNNSGISQDLWDLLPYDESLRFTGTLRQENDRLYFDVTQMTDSDGQALSTGTTIPATPATPSTAGTSPTSPTLPSSSSSSPTTPATGTTGQDSAYILSQSATRELTDEDIKGLTVQQINYAKNEIYARHGRKFQSKELQEYFEKQSWYKGTIEPGDFRESTLSDTEKRNAEFLAREERRLEPNGYKLDAKKD